MEVKNGIIIDGVLHEMTSENVPCNQCSLLRICSKSEKEEYSICLCALMNCGIYNTVFHKKEYTGASEEAGRVGV